MHACKWRLSSSKSQCVITISQMLLKGILQLPYYCLVLFDDVCSLIITPFSFYVYFMCLPAAHIPPYMYILLCLSFGAIQALGVLASFSSETTQLPLRLGEHFCSLKVATTNCVQQPAGNTIERMSRETGKVRFVCCHKKRTTFSAWHPIWYDVWTTITDNKYFA